MLLLAANFAQVANLRSPAAKAAIDNPQLFQKIPFSEISPTT
jgi:hypothetical protein